MFTFKPRYRKSTINYKEASLRNILRSVIVNRVRYVKRRFAYHKRIRTMGKIRCVEDLATMTSILRPSKLVNNYQSSYIIRIENVFSCNNGTLIFIRESLKIHFRDSIIPKGVKIEYFSFTPDLYCEKDSIIELNDKNKDCVEIYDILGLKYIEVNQLSRNL